MTDALDSQAKAKTAHPSEGIAGWVADNVWAPVKDNVLAPVGNVGVQAANTIHLTDGINLVKHATNDLGITRVSDSEKIQPFYVPKPDNFIQRSVQDLSSTAGSIMLYTLIAKGTSKLLGGASRLMASGELSSTAIASEETALNRPGVASSMLSFGARSTAVLAKEQNALLVGATAYNAARDPEKGETRTGNALGAFAQFGLYRAANSRWSSSFSAESGMLNKVRNVVLPRAIIGVGAGLAQSAVSNSVSDSINTGKFALSMGQHWQDNMGMNAAMNVVLPSLLGGKGAAAERAPLEVKTSAAVIPQAEAPSAAPTDLTTRAPGAGTGTTLEAPENVDGIRLGKSVEKVQMPEVDEPVSSTNIKVGDKVGRVGGTNPDFPGISENDVITRLITKPNGTQVTVFESGRAVIHEPGKSPATSTPDGRWLKVIDGKATEFNSKDSKASAAAKVKEEVEPQARREKPQPPDFSHLPENERPVNIGSGNGELIAKEMSNFEQSPFEIDGRKFQSVEGFYVWLKFSGDPEKQAVAQDLYSYEAKKFGKQSTATTADYDGKKIVLGSEEHHALIQRAVQAKLEQHPDLARRFAETYPRPIIHDLGYPEGPSRLPAAAFSKILTQLREGLVKGDIVTTEGTTAELSAKAAAAESAKPKMPISDALRRLDGRPSLETHPLQRYAQALENSGIDVVRLRGSGGDHLAFELPNNQVLKLSTSTFPPDFVPRQFHLHITDPQVIDAGGGLKIQLYKQPIGQTPVTPQQYRDFKAELARQGWVLTDGAEDQLSLYNGGIKLHDPFAAQRAPKPEK